MSAKPQLNFHLLDEIILGCVVSLLAHGLYYMLLQHL
jgi:hypothetical protein